jgi:hypothetical protein
MSREEEASREASREDSEEPEPSRGREIEEEEVEMAGGGVLKDEQQRHYDENGGDDVLGREKISVIAVLIHASPSPQMRQRFRWANRDDA